MKQKEIGLALDRLSEDVKEHSVDLVHQYRASGLIGVLKQAVDTPKRARAQIQNWMQEYDSKNGSGSAQSFLSACLTAANSTKTLTNVNSELAALETQAQTIVNNIQNNGWTWDQAATAIENSIGNEETFTYSELPIPEGYITIWGEPY